VLKGMRRIIIPHPFVTVLASFGDTQVCHCTELLSPLSSSSWGHQPKKSKISASIHPSLATHPVSSYFHGISWALHGLSI